jgi:hypothetical protein
LQRGEVVLMVRQLSEIPLPHEWRRRRRVKRLEWQALPPADPVEMVLRQPQNECENLRPGAFLRAIHVSQCCDTYPPGDVSCTLDLEVLESVPSNVRLPAS